MTTGNFSHLNAARAYMGPVPPSPFAHLYGTPEGIAAKAEYDRLHSEDGTASAVGPADSADRVALAAATLDALDGDASAGARLAALRPKFAAAEQEAARKEKRERAKAKSFAERARVHYDYLIGAIDWNEYQRRRR